MLGDGKSSEGAEVSRVLDHKPEIREWLATCPKCHGFGTVRQRGKPQEGDEQWRRDTGRCPMCGGKGSVRVKRI